VTAQPVSFGLTLPQRGAFFGITSIAEMLAMAGEADRSGVFDSIWVGDSLFAKPRPDSISLLGALAATTERVKLAVGCMASFPVRDPIIFAYQWASLDLISRGRMLLAACTGLGGPSDSEGQHWGIPNAERVARLVENIEICRKLWSGEDVSFTGKFRSFEHVTVRPQPVQQACPIWIAANPIKPQFIDKAMQRVAHIADGWMSVQLAPRMVASLRAKLRGFLEEEKRDPNEFPDLLYHNINVGSDRERALEETQRFLDAYYGPGIFSPAMTSAWTAAGTPQECIEHLRELVRDGARAIALRFTSWQQREQYKRVVNEVLPHVRDF
jgi:alkanesulfonate monooxygenase SsuD/methylene tetrahydromethanopterin reductase-like flavin-dependent oxidoreductase (luciferase family)